MITKDVTVVDSLPNAPHPRETFALIGQGAAEAAFLDAYRSGRFPHAWILAGPEGIGKATFAYRAARFIMVNPDPTSAAVQSARSLDVDVELPAARKVLALSHPDVFVLRRQKEHDKKTVPTEISVNAARGAVRFFESTAGEGGWRVLIVDHADELNRNSANALLKAIEEPPARALIMMVSHAPGRLLPTIRSRCRMLNFNILNDAQVKQALDASGEAPDSALNVRAAALAKGSVRMAFSRLDERMISIVEHVTRLLDAMPELSRKEVQAMAETLAKRDSQADLDTVLDTIYTWLSTETHSRAEEGAARLAPLAEVWEKIGRATREADSLNLDRRALVLILFADLAEAVRRSRAA